MRTGRLRQFLLLLFFCACSADAWAASEISEDPYQIFHNYLNVMGGLDRLKAIKTAYSEGKNVYDGLEGSFSYWEEKPLKYRLEQDYSIIALTEGDDGRFAWQKDLNGQVLILKDEETQKRRRIKALLENYEHINPSSQFFSLIFEGREKVGSSECLVVRMTNSINDDIVLYYFDKANSYLVKTISKQPDMEIHTTYSDYRQVDGILLPFYEDSLISPREKRETTIVSTYRLNPVVDPTVFLVPEQRKGFELSTGTNTENIKFELVENMLYLPVRLGDETFLWALDSGASLSIIDAQYAARLGLTPRGEVKGFGFGETFALSFVMLPESQVGGVRINPRKVYVFEGLAAGSYEPRKYGILGYDFLSRFVTKIDYANRTISFYDPATFSYNGDGVVINAPLKYQTFTVPVVVDGKLKGNFSIDIGSYSSSLYYPYALKHKLLDRKGILTISRGLAGEFTERLVRFQTLSINGFTIKEPVFAIPLERGKGATAVGEQAGNLGNSILRRFVVYLDYARQQIILEKGNDFNRLFPSDKSGMVIGRTDQGLPVVAYVAPETPAARTGFVVGDIINAVNGINVQQYHGIVPIIELLRQKAGTAHRFVIFREGKALTLTIKLEELSLVSQRLIK